MVAAPSEFRYARNGDARIAYQVLGQGSIDLVLVPGFPSNIEIHWEDAGYSHLLRRLSSFSRLIQFDPRGSGLSERIDPQALPSLETRLQDLCAVLDAVGSGRTALIGLSDGAPLALRFAAQWPQRVRALVLCGGYAHFHDSVLSPAALTRFLAEIEQAWGQGATLRACAPGRANDRQFSAWWAHLERLSATSTAALAMVRMHAAGDARPVLAKIGAPTLVIHRTDDARVTVEAGRYLAAHIPGARWLELPGRDHPVFVGELDRSIDAIEEFLTGARAYPVTSRVLAALQVARIIGTERLNAALGDGRWLERVERLREAALGIAGRLDGRICRWEADTMLARFDAPARAARCAVELRDAGKRLELRLAHALHVGEVEIQEGSVGGIAVFVAERIAAHAQADEVLASTLVAELAAGSGLRFVARESINIAGLERPISLVAIATEQHLEPATRSPGASDLSKLSAREREVLALIADGSSNASIAAALRLSEHTVKRHVANILLKLDLPTRAAAAALAARQPP